VKKVYVAAAYQVTDGFTVLGYFPSEKLAIARCEKEVAESPITKRHEESIARHKTKGTWGTKGYPGPETKWEPWVHESPTERRLGGHVKRKLNGTMLSWWTAQSVGGINGNRWSNLVAAEVALEGSAVDQLAEVARGN